MRKQSRTGKAGASTLPSQALVQHKFWIHLGKPLVLTPHSFHWRGRIAENTVFYSFLLYLYQEQIKKPQCFPENWKKVRIFWFHSMRLTQEGWNVLIPVSSNCLIDCYDKPIIKSLFPRHPTSEMLNIVVCTSRHSLFSVHCKLFQGWEILCALLQAVCLAVPALK